MVASRQVEILFHRGIGRQRGLGLGELAQVFGRTAVPFLRNYIVPAAKHVDSDLMEFAAPEFAEVVSGRKEIETAAQSAGRQTQRKHLGSVSRKRTSSGVIPPNSAKRPVGRKEIYLQTFSHLSCRVLFDMNLLWKFLENSEGKSQ